MPAVARGGASARLASRHPADHPTVPCRPGGRELVRYGGAATPPPGGWLCGAISSQSFSSRLIYPSRPSTSWPRCIATTVTRRRSSGCAVYCANWRLNSDLGNFTPQSAQPHQRSDPPESRRASKSDPVLIFSVILFLFLESDAELADEHVLGPFGVRDDGAFAVHVLDAGRDERDRVPDDVDKGVPQFLVVCNRLGRPDQLRRYVLVSKAGREGRPQVRRPPVLIATIRTIAEDRLEDDIRCRHPARAARLRRRARGLDGEVGGHRDKSGF